MKRSTRRELLERVRAQLTALADLDVASYPHEPLLPAMWQLRENLTA